MDTGSLVITMSLGTSIVMSRDSRWSAADCSSRTVCASAALAATCSSRAVCMAVATLWKFSNEVLRQLISVSFSLRRVSLWSNVRIMSSLSASLSCLPCACPLSYTSSASCLSSRILSAILSCDSTFSRARSFATVSLAAVTLDRRCSFSISVVSFK